MRAHLAGCTIVAFALSGCGGGGGSSPAPKPPNGVTTQVGTGVSGTLTLTVANGTGVSANKRAPKFVSPGALSAGVSVNTEQVQYVDVSSSSPLCTTTQSVRTCTILVGAPAGQATFNVSLYDAAIGGGHLLGSGSNSATIVSSQTFNVAIGVNPVVSSISNAGALQLNFTPGTASQSASFTPIFADPSGQAITGSGNVPNFLFPVTLSFSDPHVTAQPATLTTPGQSFKVVYDGSSSVSPNVTSSVKYNGVQIYSANVPFGSTNIAVTRCNFSPQTQGGNVPGQITVGPDNKIWFADTTANKIGVIDPAVGCSSMTFYNNLTGAGGPVGIAAGGDGMIWYSNGALAIGRLDPATGLAPLSGPASITVSGANGHVNALAKDSQGNVWYLNSGTGFSQVAYVDMSFAVHTFGPTPTANAINATSMLALGPDNAMWATEPFTAPTAQVVRVNTPANGSTGTMVESDIPNTASSIFPFDLAAGPDGNLWIPVFASNANNQFFAKFTPGSSQLSAGAFTEFPTAIDPNAFANLVTMFKGGDGNMWMAEGGGAVKIPVANPGAPVVEFFTDNGQTTMIRCIAGPDGNNWCTVYGSAPLGQGFINTYDGVIYWTPH